MMPPKQLMDDRKTDRLNTISHHVQMDVDMPDVNMPSKVRVYTAYKFLFATKHTSLAQWKHYG